MIRDVTVQCQNIVTMMSCVKTSQIFVSSSLRLEVLLEDVVGGTLLAPVPDDCRGALDHLPSLALSVDLAETCPLAQLHVAVHLMITQLIDCHRVELLSGLIMTTLLTLIRGMPCSMHRAEISFLYMGSSQFSARMQSSAWRLSRAFWVSLTPLQHECGVVMVFTGTGWRFNVNIVTKNQPQIA